MIGKPPGNPIQANIDQMMENKGATNPEDGLKMQVVNMFQQANFFGN